MIVLERRSWLQIVIAVREGALPRIWKRLFGTTAVACVVTFLHERWNLLDTSLTPLPFTLIGVALGVFLGFRNNAGYDRFWEGRKLWGQLGNTCRTLARRTLTLLGANASIGEAPERDALRREVVHTLVGYVHSVTDVLRAERGAELPSPLLSLRRIGELVSRAHEKKWVDPMHVSLYEDCLAQLTDIQGSCERIRNTPTPASYTILIHQIVAVYCFTLPLGIVNEVSYMTPFVVLLIAFAFFGLDAIGEEIENPFGTDPNDLPLHALAIDIERDLRAELGEPLPPRPTAVHGILL